MRWRATTDVDPVDVALVRRAVALLIEQLRWLSVAPDRSMIDPSDGRALPGLRLLHGEHAHVGAVYEATTATNRDPLRDRGDGRVRVGRREMRADDPRLAQFRRGVESMPPTRSETFELLADSPAELRWVTTGASTRAVVSLAEPRAPTAITFESGPLGDAPRDAGVHSTGQIDLAALATIAGADAAPVRGTATHRRFVGGWAVTIEPIDARWRVHVRASLRGRGIARPVVAVLGLLVGWKVRRLLGEQLDQLGDDLAPHIEAIRERPTPELVAAHWRAGLLRPFEVPR